MGFSDFANGSLVKKYVAVEYDEETQKNLRQWCFTNGFDLTWKYDETRQDAEDFKFHTTIFYTKSEHMPGISFEPFYAEASAFGFEVLGKEREIPTLRIYSGDLIKLRRKFYEKGYRDEWPKWKPHISISYAPSFPNLEKLSPPGFPLRIDRLKIEDLIE